jgi:hypothetical protein
MFGVSGASDATGKFAAVIVLMAGAGIGSAGARFEAGGFECGFPAGGCGVLDLAPVGMARLDAEEADFALGLTADIAEAVAIALSLKGVGCIAPTLTAVLTDLVIDGPGCTFEGGTAAPDKGATATAAGATTDLVILSALVDALARPAFVVPVGREGFGVLAGNDPLGTLTVTGEAAVTPESTVFGIALDVSAGWAGAAAGRAATPRAMLPNEAVDAVALPSAGLPPLSSWGDTLGRALSGM